jgi:hypothetical protein
MLSPSLAMRPPFPARSVTASAVFSQPYKGTLMEGREVGYSQDLNGLLGFHRAVGQLSARHTKDSSHE